MRRVLDDFRDATRSLRKHPRFLIGASLTLALGIGAVTAIFSVVNGVLFTPLPYPQADRLVNIWSTAPGLGYDRFPLSPDLFLFYRRHNTVFDDAALSQGARANLTDGGPPEVVDAAMTTHSYFATLAVEFAHGRAYREDEDTPDAPRVAVMSQRLWSRRYRADPAIVGQTIRVNGEPTQIVGIAPAVMDRRNSPDLWMPARFNRTNPPAGNFGWAAVGRLKTGVTPEEAAAQLEPLVQRAMNEYIQSPNYRAFLTDGRYRPLVHPMIEDLIGSVREPLWILLGTVGIVLLIACGNVANLCLVRAESRQRELAVRTALGGSRRGLLRMLLAESLLLSSIGTALGVALAALALPLLLQMAPATLPRLDHVRIDISVLLFAAGAAVVSALIFGLVPAIRYTRPAVLAALRHGGRSATDHPSRQRGRQVLVIAQTALALVLLVGSGLLARSFARVMGAAHGFVPDHVLTFRVALPQMTYPKPPEVARFTEQLVEKLSSLPGIESAGAASAVPLALTMSGTAFEFAGHPVEAGRLPPIVNYADVTPGYFKTMGIPVLRGEDFTSSDTREGVRTAIINKAAAERYWPGEDPIGRSLRMSQSGDADAHTRPWYLVKAIVQDVRHNNLREPAAPQIFFPVNAAGSGVDNNAPRALMFVVKGRHAEAQGDAIRQAVWSLNPDLPVASLRTMNDVVEESMVQFTFTMVTLGIAAVVALVLGAVGLYGVLSYAVSLRTREIGVRLALGAPPARVQRAVIVNAALIVGIGLALGAAAAAGVTRFLGGMLYETRPLDAVTFATMSALLFAIGVLAAYLPARRAAAVSPLEAMKTE
jgi:predicted permease